MEDVRKDYIAILSDNELEHMQIVLNGFIRGYTMHTVTPTASRMSGVLKRIPAIKRYMERSFKEYRTNLDDYPGLWLETHKETIDRTAEFYAKQFESADSIVGYYNRLLKTNKFAAFMKKELSGRIFDSLMSLHIIRLTPSFKDRPIMMARTPVNKFVAEYAESQYKVKYDIRWVRPVFWNAFVLCGYYGWLLKEFLRRPLVFNRARKKYRLAIEAAWGFHRETLRNDMVIDGDRLKKRDLLILKMSKAPEPNRLRAYEEAGNRGFATASVPEMVLNINKNIFGILYFYFCVPAIAYFLALFKGEACFLYYLLAFHKRALPIEVLMNSYDIKCHISIKDWGDIEETIIFNKYGAKNVIFHWSDMTYFKTYTHTFIAHNVYFTWGDVHYDFNDSGNYSVDRRINIGCIYRGACMEASGRRESITSRMPNFKKTRKVVAFFDTSFDRYAYFTDRFFIDFIRMIRDFCYRNPDVNVLFKPKSGRESVLKSLRENGQVYDGLMDEMLSCGNFIYLDPAEWSIEDAIGISDVCVTMGMTSPSTIALICGKNGLYFDDRGNSYHPFAGRYKNDIVFNDKELLFGRINDILEGRFDAADVIGKDDMNKYDAFQDDGAMKRISENLYELTR